MMTTITPRSLLRAVRRYCRARHVSPTSFSRKMVGDAQLIAALQKGRRPRRTASKVCRSIVSHRPTPQPPCDEEV